MEDLYTRLDKLEKVYNRVENYAEGKSQEDYNTIIEQVNYLIREYHNTCIELAKTIGKTKLQLQGKQVAVLDKGWVEFRDLMGDDLEIVACARTSFLGESKGDDKDNRLLRRLMKDWHTSPFEMVQFKFRINAPVVVWWQWVRHRTQSYNLQSGRYVPFEENSFYVPVQWRLQSKSNKQGSDGLLPQAEAEKLMKRLILIYDICYWHYKWALGLGVAREQARLFLPAWGSYYTGVISVNAHNLMGFLRLRMAEDAQWEIRQYADVIYHEFFKQLLPVTSQAFEEYRL